MWRDNFLQLFHESELSAKQLAEKSCVSENTIKRIIKDANVTLRLDTLDQLAKGLGVKTEDITNDTNAVIGNEKLESLQNELALLKADYDILLTNNNLLKTENSTLTARNELLEIKLMYTEKLLKVYEKYEK